MKDTLPKKASALIEGALKDLEKIEKDKRYRVSMDQVWHDVSETKCRVCFAGAVMAKSLKVPIDEDMDPSLLGGSISPKLNALNAFRIGCVGEGLEYLNANSHFIRNVNIPSYDENKRGFKKAMKLLAKMLKLEGN